MYFGHHFVTHIYSEYVIVEMLLVLNRTFENCAEK
jgi:hypothetical protein